jgi:ribulose 1,5-bisphosphate carboxylase large subunit-like protein
MREEVDEVVAEGPLPERKMIRDYEPATQVAARFEISSGGLIGGDTAGVDVMGDGRLVPFRGGVMRRELEPKGNQTPFDAVRKALR